MIRTSGLISLALLPLLSGCTGADSAKNLKLVPVKGTLYLDDKPAANQQFTLTPTSPAATQRTANGKTDAEGKFALQTYAPGDGAAPGTYKILLSGGAGGGPADKPDPMALMAAAQGTATQETELTIPEEGSASFDIHLKSGQGAGGSPGKIGIGL